MNMYCTFVLNIYLLSRYNEKEEDGGVELEIKGVEGQNVMNEIFPRGFVFMRVVPHLKILDMVA